MFIKSFCFHHSINVSGVINLVYLSNILQNNEIVSMLEILYDVIVLFLERGGNGGGSRCCRRAQSE